MDIVRYSPGVPLDLCNLLYVYSLSTLIKYSRFDSIHRLPLEFEELLNIVEALKIIDYGLL